jgi:heptosyltransferase-2
MAAGARMRVGLDNGRGYFLNLRAPDLGFGAMHEVDYWLRVVELLGSDRHAGWRPHIPIDDQSRSDVADLLANSGINRASPLVAVHPGAGWYSRARIWPVEGFARVARGLMESHGAAVAIVGGPDEGEIAQRLEEMAGGSGRVVNLVGRTSIAQTAALLEKCDLFLGNDSGPMHIAAAVGTPVVAVFGPSNIGAWGPYSPEGERSPHTVVARDLPCMPCFYRGHSVGLREGCGTRECLTLLDARGVLEACRRTLDRVFSREPSPEEVLTRAT